MKEKHKTKKTRKKQTKIENNMGDGVTGCTEIASDRRFDKKVGDKWLRCAFKLGFLQLICKTSSIYKSDLELIGHFKRKAYFYYDVTCCQYIKI